MRSHHAFNLWTSGQNREKVLTADIVATPLSGNAPLVVSFTANALGGSETYTYTWSFGDNTTATGRTVSKTYSTAGSYTVSLTVNDGARTATDTVTILVATPSTPLTATLSANRLSGPTPLEVTFTTRPSGGSGVYTVTYDFGDGTSGGGLSTTKTYTTVGTYTARATISDGNTSVTRSLSVTTSQPATTPVVASASATPTSGTTPLTVAFRAGASGGSGSYTYAWTFGDGGRSSEPNPSYTYVSPGSYTASLTVSSGVLSDSKTVQIEVSGSGSGSADFSTWRNKTIPPNNDWVTYASFEGNPDFSQSALSSTMQSQYNKLLTFHRRLLLREGETLTIPGATQTARYIKSGVPYGYFTSGGGDRDWYTAMRAPHTGNLQNIRTFSRQAYQFADNALNMLNLTHDLRWLDFACWWFQAYWDACVTYCDAEITWSGTGANRTVSSSTNKSGKAYGYRAWLKKDGQGNIDYRTPTDAEHKKAANWSDVRYRPKGKIGGNWADGSMANAPSHSFLALPGNDDNIALSNNGTFMGTNLDIEDNLAFGIWAKFLRAAYVNRAKTSPGGYNYADMHEMCRHLIFDNLFPLYALDAPGSNFAKYNGHPAMQLLLTHPVSMEAKMYWHLHWYAKARGGTTWNARADDYYNAFLFLAEALARDLLWVDLSDQTVFDNNLTAANTYNESCLIALHPHAVGLGGYGRSYTVNSDSWRSENGIGWGSKSNRSPRKDVGNVKLVYFHVTCDTALDLYLSRYWDELKTDADRQRVKTRKGKSDASKGEYIWSLKHLQGWAALLTYGCSVDPSDGTRNKLFWTNIHGFATDEQAGNWFWKNRANMQTYGGGSGNDGFNTVPFFLNAPASTTLMFTGAMTGKYKDKLWDAVNAQKSHEGGWAVGDTDQLIPSGIELMTGLIKGGD